MNYYYYRFLDIKRTIRDFFFPRQKWLTKTIPNSWKDKTELIEDLLFECIKHYVESERCFEVIDWNYHETRKETEKFIKECYVWITQDRKKLTDGIQRIIEAGFSDIKNIMEDFQNSEITYEERYPNLSNLEKELEEKDTYFLTGIIKYRRFLWT